MRKSFESFITALGLEHFEAEELLVHVDRPGNEFPPRRLWGNVVPTVVMIDALRSHFGLPVLITSGHRSEAYNAFVGGVAHSQHRAFGALDFVVLGGGTRLQRAAAEWLRHHQGMEIHLPCDARRVQLDADTPFYETPRAPSGADIWLGGVGSYPHFTHIDSRGRTALW